MSGEMERRENQTPSGSREKEGDDLRRSTKSSHPSRIPKSKTTEGGHGKSTKGRRNGDEVPGSSRHKPTTAHSHRSPNQEDQKTRPSSKVKSRETDLLPKLPSIPSDTDTSPEAKRERIEKWRQEGAKCLRQKQETEEALRTMCSSHKKTEKSSKSKDEGVRDQTHPSRRHQSHHGIVESNSNQLVKELEDRKREVTHSITKSLHGKTTAGNGSPEKETKGREVAEKSRKSGHPLTPSTPKSGPSGRMSTSETTLDGLRSPSTKTLKKVEDFPTLRVMNLPLSLTLNDLKNLFPHSTSVTLPIKEFGQVESEMSVGQAVPNPTALVKFSTRAEAEEVMAHFQGLRIRGQKLKISLA